MGHMLKNLLSILVWELIGLLYMHWIKTLLILTFFGVEHIPKEIKKITGNKNIKTNIFRIQAYDSVMCGYFCTGFIDFMLAGKA